MHQARSQGEGSRLAEDPYSMITLRRVQCVSVTQALDYCDDKTIDSNTRRCSTRDCRSSS